MNPRQEPSPILVIAVLLLVQLLFGVGYSSSKLLVGAFPPLAWASLRILLSTPLLFGIAILLKRPRPRFDRSFLLPAAFFSLLGVAFNQGAFLAGLKHTTITNAAILNTLIPIFTVFIVTLRGLEPLSTRKAAGFACALAGALLLCHGESLSFTGRTLFGDGLVLVNCLSYSLFLAFSKPALGKFDPFWTTAWLFFFGGIAITLLALPQLRDFAWPPMTPTLWLCAAFTILGATLLTYLLNVWALAHTNSSHVALFGYLQSVIAALVSWAWLGEKLTLRAGGASGMIFAGLLLGLGTRAPAPQASPPEERK